MMILTLVSHLESDGYGLHDAFVLFLLDKILQFQTALSVSKHYVFSLRIWQLYGINSITKIEYHHTMLTYLYELC